MDSNPIRESMWEFNAPKFVDFTAPIDDDNADAWFDAQESTLMGHNATSIPLEAEDVVQDPVVKTEPVVTAQKQILEDIQPAPEPQSHPQICTDLQAWDRAKRKQKTNEPPVAAAVRRSPRVQRKVVNQEQKQSTPQISRPLKRRSEATPQQKPVVKSARRSVPHTSVSSTSSVDSGISVTSQENKASKIPKITLPSTPSFMKRQQSKVKVEAGKVKTTEELEMERIRNMQQKLAENRRKNQSSYRRAIEGQRYVPKRSTAGLTRPQEFHFATDSRIKPHEMVTRQDDGSKDFAKQLRHHESPAKSKPKATKVQPFHFSEMHKRRSSAESAPEGKYKSMAELVNGFSRTPERFRSKPRSRGVSPAGKQTTSPKLTVPKTPQFAPTRKRPSGAISRAEIEEKEVEEIKKYKFKANKLDERIFSNPNLGVKKVEPKPVTEPVDVQFETDRRLRDKAHSQPVDDQSHAQIDTSGPRAHCFQDDQKIVRARPVPHMGIPFQPKLNHKATVPQPFNFEERDKKMQAQKEEKISKILEDDKKAAEFHAQPLPATPAPLPPKKHIVPTVPETPNLNVKQRGLIKAEKWSKQIEEELRQQKSQLNFKAKPCKVTYEQPFVPQKSQKPLTEVSEFQLNTDQRSKEREDFEKHRQEEEFKRDLVAKQRLEEREREEQAEVARLRQELVHKPNPIRHYKGVEVEPSDRPLTQPVTPRFSERISKKYRV